MTTDRDDLDALPHARCRDCGGYFAAVELIKGRCRDCDEVKGRINKRKTKGDEPDEKHYDF